MSAAATLYAAGRTGLRDGARLAEKLIDDGSAIRVLERLKQESNTP
jgi:anthranilate phosphoribosyltransferase